jgi:hypothetical protein
MFASLPTFFLFTVGLWSITFHFIVRSVYNKGHVNGSGMGSESQSSASRTKGNDQRASLSVRLSVSHSFG